MSELTQTKRFLDSQTDEAAAVAGGGTTRDPPASQLLKSVVDDTLSVSHGLICGLMCRTVMDRADKSMTMVWDYILGMFTLTAGL